LLRGAAECSAAGQTRCTTQIAQLRNLPKFPVIQRQRRRLRPAALLCVPLVSLVTKAPDAALVQSIFACCDRKVEVTVKDHIGSEG